MPETKLSGALPAASNRSEKERQEPAVKEQHRIFKQILVLALLAIGILALLVAYSSLIWEIFRTTLLDGKPVKEWLWVIGQIVILLLGSWLFLGISRALLARYLESIGRKKETKVLLSLYSYVIWLFTILLVAATIFKDIAIILASLGLLGFGLTLALQKPILNLVGWLTIVFNKPFSIGDRIEIGGNRGDVISIQAMYTVIQATRGMTHEQSEKVVTIPNEVILTAPLSNFTKRANWYWDDFTVMITHASNWKKAEAILLEIAESIMLQYVEQQSLQAAGKERKSFEEAIRFLHSASQSFTRKRKTDRFSPFAGEGIKESEKKDFPKPSVRIDFMENAIGLNVLYLADIRYTREMRAAIARKFLLAIATNRDIVMYRPNPPEPEHVH